MVDLHGLQGKTSRNIKEHQGFIIIVILLLIILILLILLIVIIIIIIVIIVVIIVVILAWRFQHSSFVSLMMWFGDFSPITDA